MLDQRLRRWPNLNHHWVSVPSLLGKPSCQYMRGVSCFELPTVTQQLAFKHNAQLRALVELLIHRCPVRVMRL